MNWTSTDSSLFFTKNDSKDPRLGESVIDCAASAATSAASGGDSQTAIRLWGYCDDEGIALNGGRTGARLAPPLIRKFLYKMTASQDFSQAHKIFDFGDLHPGKLSLEERHDAGKKLATTNFSQSGLCLSFGGGHDYGFPDGAAFIEAHSKGPRPFILNVDAHLDVRPADQNFNSGTPFRRLLENYHGQFNFAQLGIQPQCNSLEHAEWALSKGAAIAWISELRSAGVIKTLQRLTTNLKAKDPVWISLDIDAFSESVAPGCSQAWGSGIDFHDFQLILNFLRLNFNLRGLSIYEVSPPLDHGFMTSKLAALCTYYFLHAKESQKGGSHARIW